MWDSADSAVISPRWGVQVALLPCQAGVCSKITFFNQVVYRIFKLKVFIPVISSSAWISLTGPQSILEKICGKRAAPSPF